MIRKGFVYEESFGTISDNDENSSDVRLRPHHVLCIQFFVGQGYSEKFVQGMADVIKALNHNDPQIQLVKECDVICGSCPMNENGKCSSDSKVQSIDKRALKEYGLDFGDKMNWSSLVELARSRVIYKGRLPHVCENCSWSHLCSGEKAE